MEKGAEEFAERTFSSKFFVFALTKAETEHKFIEGICDPKQFYPFEREKINLEGGEKDGSDQA